MPATESEARFNRWLVWLGQECGQGLSFSELRRGAQALSNDYVSRRIESQGSARALEGRAKRAAFAMFYSPLHYLVARRVLDDSGLTSLPLTRILDVGCGLGAAGAAWAHGSPARPRVWACDKNGWAVQTARASFRELGLRARVERRSVLAMTAPTRGDVILASYVVNELTAAERSEFLAMCLGARQSSGILILEPIAIRPLKWWAPWTRAILEAGGREDTWELEIHLPDSLRQIDQASGWDHNRVKARTLWLPQDSGYTDFNEP